MILLAPHTAVRVRPVTTAVVTVVCVGEAGHLG